MSAAIRTAAAVCATATVLLPGVGTAAAVAGADESSGDRACAPHPPIAITEDEGSDGFIVGHDPATGAPIYRPGSGVVAGAGTAEDPYVIAGWCIRTAWPAVIHGVSITGTQAHVLVEGNTVSSPAAVPELGGDHGIRLSGVANATVAGNGVTDQWFTGIYVEDSSGVELLANTAIGNVWRGIHVVGSNDVVVRDNHAHDQPGVEGRDSRPAGVVVEDSTGTVVHGNAAARNAEGIVVRRSSGTVLEENAAMENRGSGIVVEGSNDAVVVGNATGRNGLDGIRVLDSRDVWVGDNTAQENIWMGVFAEGSDATTVHGNTLTANGRDGVFLRETRDAVLRANDLSANGRFGVRLLTAVGASIHDNRFEDNAVGLRVDAASALVAAQANWWGHATGPGGGLTDACTGTVADGAGQQIVSDGAPVCFTPWQETP